MDLYDYSLKLFGRRAVEQVALLSYFRQTLNKADIKIEPEKYLSMMYFSTFLSFFITFILSFPILLFVLGRASNPFIVVLLVSLFSSFFVSIIVLFVFFSYPGLISSGRIKKIDNIMPYVAIYLGTLAASGLPPQKFFSFLAKFKEYGEVQKEASKIAKDVDEVGLDLVSAMSRAVKNSPSRSWSEFLTGLKTTITTGGNLQMYMKEKAKSFAADFRRKVQEYATQLEVFIQMYTILVVVGAMFFIIVSSLIVTIGGLSVQMVKMIQYIVIVLGVPFLTVAFILIIKGISPFED